MSANISCRCYSCIAFQWLFSDLLLLNGDGDDGYDKMTINFTHISKRLRECARVDSELPLNFFGDIACDVRVLKSLSKTNVL